MNNYYKTLIGGLAAASIAMCPGPAPVNAPEATRAMQPRVERQEKRAARAVRLVRSCRNLAELEERLPLIAAEIQLMCASADASPLQSFYDGIKDHIPALMERTRSARGVAYMDDINLIGEAFMGTDSREERLALIFLTLPRLYQRAYVLEFLEQPGVHTMERDRAEAERLFFLSIGQNGFGEASSLIRRHWYLEDGRLPRSGDMDSFFKEFCSLR
ncbi:MAG: hypothetical protein AB1324_08145 [Candidatus Micrarchaeota archaeon]